MIQRRHWQPTPVLLPGKSHGQRSLVGCSHGVVKSWTQLRDFTFTFHFLFFFFFFFFFNFYFIFKLYITVLDLPNIKMNPPQVYIHFHALEKEMATHSSVLAWRILGTAEPGGLLSMGSHRVKHD